MILGHANPRRWLVVDRELDPQGLVYSAAAVAPHTATVRASRTIPASTRAVITSALARITRLTAATTAGYITVKCRYTFSATNVPLTIATLLTNAVGDKDGLGWGGEAPCEAGDIATIETTDPSTGGTVNYEAGINLHEFSA